MIVDDVFINVAADDDNVYKEYVINSPCVSDEDCGFASFQLPRDFWKQPISNLVMTKMTVMTFHNVTCISSDTGDINDAEWYR